MVKRASFSLPESALQGVFSALVCDLLMTLNSYAVRDAKWGLHRVVMATSIEPLAQDLHTNSQPQYKISFFTFFRGSWLEGWIFFLKPQLVLLVSPGEKLQWCRVTLTKKRVSSPTAGCALRGAQTAQTQVMAFPCAYSEQQLLVLLPTLHTTCKWYFPVHMTVTDS